MRANYSNRTRERSGSISINSKKDVDSDKARERVDSDQALADSLGIKVTPTVFINNRPVDSKDKNPEEIRADDQRCTAREIKKAGPDALRPPRITWYQTRGNDEIQMTKLEGMTHCRVTDNDTTASAAFEARTSSSVGIQISAFLSFIRHSSFVIRHSDHDRIEIPHSSLRGRCHCFCGRSVGRHVPDCAGANW